MSGEKKGTAPPVFGVLEKNQEFAMYLGLLTAQYAVLEHTVVEIISLALGKNLSAAYVIANKAWQATARIQIAKDLIACSVLAAETKEIALTLLDRAEAVNYRRNKYIHGLWGVREGTEQVVLTSRVYSKTDQRDIDAQELKNEIDEIRILQTEIALKLLSDRLIKN